MMEFFNFVPKFEGFSAGVVTLSTVSSFFGKVYGTFFGCWFEVHTKDRAIYLQYEQACLIPI
jgi:hypothetical protein